MKTPIGNRTYRSVAIAVWVCLPLMSCSRSVVKANSTASQAVPVRAALATSGDVPVDIAAVGSVEAINSVDVKSRVTGQVKLVHFAEGQSITKGQPLFTIDPEMILRQMAEQRAEMDRDVALEQQTRALTDRDTASQRQSQSEAEVALELNRAGVLSEQRTNQLVTTRETASSALRADQAATRAAASAATADSARLAQMRLQLQHTSVAAPIEGRAGAIMVKAGNIASENQTTLVSLLQISPIYVTFGIPEQALAEVQERKRSGPLDVEAVMDDGASFDGSLSFIDNTVDATTGMIRLKATFPNAQGVLWPGQFVHVRLRLRIETARTLVPEVAIQEGQDGKYLWRVRSGIASAVPVSVARTYRPQHGLAQAVLSSGVTPGDAVVTEGQLRLTPGTKVTFLNSLQAMAPAPSSIGLKVAP